MTQRERDPLLRRFRSVEDLSRTAADEVCRIAAESLAARGRFALVLAGGETPRRVYELLAAEQRRGRIDWRRVEVFWGDERAVPPDAPGSNHRMAAETLLRPVGLPADHVHRIRGEAAPEDAAEEYEQEIARAFGVTPGAPPPAFDLVLLGMGADGHTASLFPASEALEERTRWVVAARGPPPLPDRVTLTLPILNEARHVLFLVTGREKAEALAAVLDGPSGLRDLPARLVRPRAGALEWFVDDAAAARLSGRAAPAGARTLPVLAGDVGGTKTELQLFERGPHRLEPGRRAEFESRAHASLELIIDEFLDHEPWGRVEAACFAVAGPVQAGKAVTTNLPWTIEEAALARLLGTARVKLMNDLEGAAYGMLFLERDEFRILRAADPARRGNVAIIAPGTGLGEAMLYWDGARHHPVASEGGHADFAPRTDREIDLLRYLRARSGGHVSYELVLSGDGLHQIYRFLRDGGFAPEPPWLAERLTRGDPNATISELGLRGESALCVEALALFCSILGAEAGNLALKCFATGGVIVGGGIAPKIVPALVKGGFMEGMTEKGRLSGWLKQLPVSIALNARAPLIGAAHSLADLGEPSTVMREEEPCSSV